MKKVAFWILLTVDALVAAIFLYFFLIGIADGTVSSFNIILWLGIIGGLGAVLGGGFFLRRSGRNVAAMCLLALVAVPALLSALGLVVILLSNPRWN